MNRVIRLSNNKKIYKINELFKGRANEKGLNEEDVDKNELKKGMKVEKEHTPFEWLAKRIALDHLAEIPDYYTRLMKMEKDAKGDK